MNLKCIVNRKCYLHINYSHHVECDSDTIELNNVKTCMLYRDNNFDNLYPDKIFIYRRQRLICIHEQNRRRMFQLTPMILQ